MDRNKQWQKSLWNKIEKLWEKYENCSLNRKQFSLALTGSAKSENQVLKSVQWQRERKKSNALEKKKPQIDHHDDSACHSLVWWWWKKEKKKNSRTTMMMWKESNSSPARVLIFPFPENSPDGPWTFSLPSLASNFADDHKKPPEKLINFSLALKSFNDYQTNKSVRVEKKQSKV